MQLEYKILWFDDNETWLEALDKESINDQIRDWGFSPSIITVTTPGKFEEYSPFTEFDLIVIDYDLGTYENGQNFISQVRNHEVFTEVIFYTSQNISVLWESVKEDRLEGVFISHRSEIETKIPQVGRQNIRKVLDVENMRGIVMAEVGEFDFVIDEILKLSFNHLNAEQKEKVILRFQQKTKEQLENNLAKIDGLHSTSTVDETLVFCDSYKRWAMLNRIKRELPAERLIQLDDFASEILKPRNYLAHGKPKQNTNGDLIFSFGNTEYIFNESVGTELRKKILDFKAQFAEFTKKLN